MSPVGHGVVECSRCGSEVPLEDASMLNKTGSKALWRYLCAACLRSVGVPKGYEVRRDLSFLRGGTPSADSTDETDGTSTDAAVIADFVGTVVTGEMPRGMLTPGRILMNRRRLILATDDHRTVIPLGAIRDVAVRRVSESTRDVLDDVVTLNYRSEGSDEVAFVGAKHDTLESFTTVLFKALLDGTAVRFRHPVSAGGRLRGPPVCTGAISVRDGNLQLSGVDRPLVVEMDQVVHVVTYPRKWADSNDPVLAVWHVRGGVTVLSEFALPSRRTLDLLCRFILMGFGARRAAVAGLEFSRADLRCLAAVYALGATADPSPLLGSESPPVSTLTTGLVERGLLREGADGYSLTTTGRIAVHDRFDEIRAIP